MHRRGRKIARLVAHSDRHGASFHACDAATEARERSVNAWMRPKTMDQAVH